MSAFEARLIEDFGHELSNLISAGEELIHTEFHQAEDPYLVAQEFRSLIITLETGARLLQWETFADFLSALSLRVEMGVEVTMEISEIRQRLESSLDLLLKIHEVFDGVKFSDEQIAVWEDLMNAVWIEGKSVVSENPVDEIKSSEAKDDDTHFLPQMVEELHSEKKIEVQTPSSSVDSILNEGLVVDHFGMKILFPLAYLRGVSPMPGSWRHEGEKKTIEIYGSRFQVFKLQEPTDLQHHREDWRYRGTGEWLLLCTRKGNWALQVDHIYGFRLLSPRILRFEEGPLPGLRARFSHDPACWIWDTDRLLVA